MFMTPQYQYLHDRLLSIASTFDKLINVDPLAQVNESDQNLIKSYILLCHAEFEKYFEDIALAVIEDAKTKYDASGETSVALLNLALILKKEFNNNETSEDRLNKLYSNYHALIEGNHGIRKNNINELLAPIGLPVNKLSETYVAALENFGKKRGQIAHNVKEAIVSAYNYKNEKDVIARLEEETLFEIDTKVETYFS